VQDRLAVAEAHALASFHPRRRGLPNNLPFVWDEGTLRNGDLFTLSTDLGAIDLLGEIKGVGAYNEVKAHSVQVEAFERTVWTLDLPTLIHASERRDGKRTSSFSRNSKVCSKPASSLRK
jgi:hypothetical protein